MSGKEFIGTLLAVAIGTTIALAIAGIYLKSQVSSAASASTPLGALLSLISPSNTTPAA